MLATFTSKSACFTFGGDAGGRLGGGGRVSVGRGFSAPGRGFGAQRGGEGVDVRGVGDVAQLVLCLGIIKKELALHKVRQRLLHAGFFRLVQGLGTSSGQLLSTQSCRWRSKPLEHLGGGMTNRQRVKDPSFPLHLLLNPTSVFHSAA